MTVPRTLWASYTAQILHSERKPKTYAIKGTLSQTLYTLATTRIERTPMGLTYTLQKEPGGDCWAIRRQKLRIHRAPGICRDCCFLFVMLARVVGFVVGFGVFVRLLIKFGFRAPIKPYPKP